MRFGIQFCVVAVLLSGLATIDMAHAGFFGRAELGIIKQDDNSFKFIAPIGETLDEDNLRYNAARTAKLLGFSYFVIEMKTPKPEPKPKAPKNAKVDPVDASLSPAEVETPSRPTYAIVYFYNSPRKRNGTAAIAVNDIIPSENEPVANASKAPVAAPVEQVSAPVEPAPVPEKKSKKQKQEIAPVEQAIAPIDSAPIEPAPAPEKKSKKQKQEPVPVEQASAPIEPAPVVEFNKAAKQPSLQEAMQTQSSPVTIAPLPQADVAFEEQVGSVKKLKPRKKGIIWLDDQSPFPNSGGRVNELGDLFN